MPAPPSSGRDGGGGTSRSDVAEFERIDWERVEGRRRLTAERTALVVGLLALVAVYAYYRAQGSIYLVWRWNVGPADWTMLLAVVVLVAYGVVPLARNRRRLGRVVARLRARRGTALSLAGLAGVVVVGMYANAGFHSGGLVEFTTNNFEPPVWAGGTWDHPLGTDRWGYDLVQLLVAGTRPVVYLAVVTAGVIVPLATVVGLVAGYYGGLVDDLLMAYVDAQLSVPAILLYLIAFMFVGNSMFVLLVAFGLLSWGGVARIVRSETLKRREEGYVLAARAVGTPPSSVLRRHLLPNVTDTVVPATFHLIAILVLTEAGLSFLGFHASFQSWGMTVAEGLSLGPPKGVWWNSTFPAIALTLTVAGFKVAGDGLRDVLDPRGER